MDFNIRRLRALVGAKRAEAEDDVYGLREDPGHFAETITDRSGHRLDRLLDLEGKEHRVGPQSSQYYELFWDVVIAQTIGSAYGPLINWYILD